MYKNQPNPASSLPVNDYVLLQSIHPLSDNMETYCTFNYDPKNLKIFILWILLRNNARLFMEVSAVQ